jgi:phosphatidylserine/phosphatidylglycerophosphate/cardiolipin synthase-like enzyme
MFSSFSRSLTRIGTSAVSSPSRPALSWHRITPTPPWSDLLIQRRSIDIYAEKLLPSPLLDAILAAANRGVTVRILASPLDELRGATRDRVMQAIRSGHLQVRIPSPRVHAKVMLVHGTSVFLGSEKVQDALRERRRELGAVFQEPSIAARIQDTFDRDWSGKVDALE